MASFRRKYGEYIIIAQSENDYNNKVNKINRGDTDGFIKAKDMDDCSKHKKEVLGVSDMAELANIIGNLHYATLSTFLFALQTKLHEDSLKDLKDEKFKLSHSLQRASNWLFEASIDIETAYQISKPFMGNSGND